MYTVSELVPMSMENTGDVSAVANTTLGTLIIRANAKVLGWFFLVENTLTKGGTLAGTLSLKLNAVEIQTWNYVTSPAGTMVYVPLVDSLVCPPGYTFQMLVKTKPTGTGGTGNVRGFLSVMWNLDTPPAQGTGRQTGRTDW